MLCMPIVLEIQTGWGSVAEIDLSPLDEGQGYALDLAVKSFIMVVAVLYRELGMDYEEINKKSNELAVFYQSIT